MGSCGNASGGAAGAATGSDVNTAADSDIHVSGGVAPCSAPHEPTWRAATFQLGMLLQPNRNMTIPTYGTKTHQRIPIKTHGRSLYSALISVRRQKARV